MAENQISNVVPFGGNPFASAAAGGKENNLTTAMIEDATSMLAVCRDRLIDSVSAVFTRRIGRANDEFVAMAAQASSMDYQQLCFAATQFLSNNAPQLLLQFRTTYVEDFAQILSLSGSSSQTRHDALPNELSLVDDEDFEQELAITKLTARAAFNCSQQLVPLDRRLVVLMGVQRITQENNPLYPEVIFNSMLQALSRMDLDRELALMLLESFERQTASELPAIYAEINRYLAESGVLPQMSLKSSHSQGDLQGDGSRRNHASGAAQVDQRGGPDTSPSANQDIFSQLLHAIQAASAIRSGTPSWQSGQQAGHGLPRQSMPLSDGMGPQSFSSGQLLDALGDLQRGQVDPGQMPGLGSVRVEPHSGDVLRQIRATPMASWSHPMDAMTMDIVAMLFDAIFRDPDLPASVRAEIAKLQIPVLKVALLEKQFFSDRKHPARRLLDAIAHAGIGRSDQDEPRLLEIIRRVVDAVLEDFESDVGVFETQIEALGDFLREEEAAAHKKATCMVDELAARERKELAAGRAAAEVGARIEQRTAPALIADFLTHHWRLVLVDVFVRYGESATEWTKSLQLMDQLLWSVAPKSGSQERDQLVVTLPAMLEGLREGIERIEMHEVWSGFFSDLIQLHVAALRKDVSQDPSPQQVRDSMQTVSAHASATTSADRAVEADAPLAHFTTGGRTRHTQDETPPKIAEPPADDAYAGLVRKLEVGAWIEFQSARGTRNTLRLNWVSEFRRVFLFTNRQGENAMTLAASSLAEHLRKRTARLLSQNPLTERAVEQVMEQVMPAHAEPASESRPRGYAWE